MSATAFQPEPSANAPCTRTTFLIFVIVTLLSSLSFSESCISFEHEMDRTRNGHGTIESTDHFCGFLLQMWSDESIRLRERIAVRVFRQTSGGVSAHASTYPELRQRHLQSPGKGGLIGKSGLR